MKNLITDYSLAGALLLTLSISSCSKTEVGNVIPQTSTDERAADSSGGFLYSMSNDSLNNQIIVFALDSTGHPVPKGMVNSEGGGTGAPLGSQGAIAVDHQNKMLFAVNAGTNSIASFKIHSDGSLTLVDTSSTGGKEPVSITVYNQWVYVVNAKSGNIEGFKVDASGNLTAIAGSSQSLSTTLADPAEIKFKPNGTVLYVTEKATNMIDAFLVDPSGVAGAGTFTASNGNTPFGFDFSIGVNMIVSDAFGGNANASALSSYYAGNAGNITSVGSPVKNNQTSACWVVISRDKKHVFTTNTASNTISSYEVQQGGILNLLSPVAATTGAAPADVVILNNGKYMYTVNQTALSLGEFKLSAKGIQSIGEYMGLPAGASGLVAN